jgi:hypothetical protein
MASIFFRFVGPDGREIVYRFDAGLSKPAPVVRLTRPHGEAGPPEFVMQTLG